MVHGRPTARRCGSATSGTKPGAGAASLVFDLSIAHDRFGSNSHVQQNGLLTHQQDLDGPLRVAAQRKINAYRQQYTGNQNISFLPAITSTSTRMHDEFLRLIFLQAHLETEAHFAAAGMSLQNYQTDAFRFKRAAFLQSLKSKIGLAASKAAGSVQPQYRGLWHRGSPSARSSLRSPSPPPPPFTHYPSPPRSLVCDGQTKASARRLS